MYKDLPADRVFGMSAWTLAIAQDLRLPEARAFVSAKAFGSQGPVQI